MRALAMLLFGLWAIPADGVLIQTDLAVGSGDGLLTLDTETQLLWLDLTETAGLSFNQVSAQLGQDGRFPGFRYATNDQIFELWRNAGLVDINLPGFLNFTEANYQPASDLIALIGATQISGIGGGQIIANGISATPRPNFSDYRLTALVQLSEFAPPFTAEATSNGYILVGYGIPPVGSWLMKPVPEPGTIGLVALGLMALRSARRRMPS